MVVDYQIILTSEDGEWYGRGLELPHVFGDGPTPAKCIASTREALTAAVGYILEQGQTPPAPAKQGKRTTQVNVRLTMEEKVILEGTARRKGFQGLADFIRASALESARERRSLLRSCRSHRRAVAMLAGLIGPSAWRSGIW